MMQTRRKAPSDANAWRHTLCALGASVALAVPSAAQGRVIVDAAVGYAAGVDAPALRDGGISARLGLTRARAAGIEWGVAMGRDVIEDRIRVTGTLYRNPATGGIGTQPCAGCVAGAQRDQTRSVAWYIAPAVTVRRRGASVQPFATLAIGVYRLVDERNTRFDPTTGDATGASSTRSAAWTGGGQAGVGVRIPATRRVSIDVMTQLHGALRIGDDFAGGTAYAVAAVGVSVR